ncbi:MAG: 50S ribosomal protein L4 [Neisseriales bacterium]|uniref:Large ribosomal subunit protein uL4 n=1 Tax=Aquella oligotrophica TaxID=2067065 RepID=A0A2I7N8S8_9NEIS|nr:50S ribosomal protein L4 [Aquella oligotrophica]AUR52858.1 50S ribosomal protein L4 [Aquella oligotrophica]TXI92629.1 MAG: 50S ribosomal protein L4 [Neisseriales bacterium]
MELKLLNMQGADAGQLTVSDALFGREYNEALVHQVVTAYLANARSGNSKQKTRAEVTHSTKKPWRQKGTGRARIGTTTSPVWRGGGRAFPNTPEENFTQKVNRKMYRAGIAAILSKLVADGRLVIANELNIDSPKTKSFVSVLNNLSLNNETVLVIVDELTENVYYASRNLPTVLVLEAHQIDPYTLLRCNKVVFTQKAIEKVQEHLV